MDYAIVCAVAVVAGALTLFTGFGLGTLLLPAFALAFPAELDPSVAVAATAVVHLANNLFKLGLVGKWAEWGVVLRFGLPAVLFAAIGAAALEVVARLNTTLIAYDAVGVVGEITPVGLLVGGLVIVFGVLELRDIEKAGFDPKLLPLGGAISGFFGGLSGHQGALRSAFLIKAGLDKKAFVGSSAACSAMVDITRLAVYALGVGGLASAFDSGHGDIGTRQWGLVAAACVAAFAGAFVGSKLVRKTRLETVRHVVGVMLVLAGVVMTLGLA